MGDGGNEDGCRNVENREKRTVILETEGGMAQSVRVVREGGKETGKL